jgi:flagellar hook assembly protein FlgD
MKYQALKHRKIKLANKATSELDAREGVVLVPQDGAKVFIHWTNENGKLVNTYTMTFPTRVSGNLKLINGSDKETTVQIIEL